MKMTFDIDGSITAAARETLEQLESGAYDAIKVIGEASKAALRREVRNAGMSARLANTWRGQVYPRRPSLSAAYSLWVTGSGEGSRRGERATAATVIEAQMGTVIRASRKRFLAIPTRWAKAGSGRTRGGQFAPKYLTPDEWERANGKKLFFAPTGKGEFALWGEVDTKPRTGSTRGVRAIKRVVFILKRSVSLRARLRSADATTANIIARLPETLAQKMGD
jgi:hypothetical protein